MGKPSALTHLEQPVIIRASLGEQTLLAQLGGVTVLPIERIPLERPVTTEEITGEQILLEPPEEVMEQLAGLTLSVLPDVDS